MIDKLKCLIEFRFLQPLRFAFVILYIVLLLYGVTREIVPDEYEKKLNVIFLVLYLLWFALFIIKAYIENVGYKLLNLQIDKISVNISIDEVQHIRNRAYDKVLIKLQVKDKENINYFAKYVCDPLYFETYLKQKLYRGIDEDIFIYRTKGKKYYIDIKDVLKRNDKKAIGCDNKDWHVSNKQSVITILLSALICISILYILFNLVDYNSSNVISGVIVFVLILFILFVMTKK